MNVTIQPYLSWLDLPWLDLTLIWPDLTCPVLSWLDLPCPYLTCPDSTCPALTFSDLTCPDLDCHDLPCPDLSGSDLTWLDLEEFKSSWIPKLGTRRRSRQAPDTFQISSRHLPHTFRHHPFTQDALKTPSYYNQKVYSKCQVIPRVVGGWWVVL